MEQRGDHDHDTYRRQLRYLGISFAWRHAFRRSAPGMSITQASTSACSSWPAPWSATGTSRSLNETISYCGGPAGPHPCGTGTAQAAQLAGPTPVITAIWPDRQAPAVRPLGTYGHSEPGPL